MSLKKSTIYGSGTVGITAFLSLIASSCSLSSINLKNYIFSGFDVSLFSMLRPLDRFLVIVASSGTCK